MLCARDSRGTRWPSGQWVAAYWCNCRRTSDPTPYCTGQAQDHTPAAGDPPHKGDNSLAQKDGPAALFSVSHVNPWLAFCGLDLGSAGERVPSGTRWTEVSFSALKANRRSFDITLGEHRSRTGLEQWTPVSWTYGEWGMDRMADWRKTRLFLNSLSWFRNLGDLPRGPAW